MAEIKFKVELDVEKDVIDKLSTEENKQLIYGAFDVLSASDKEEIMKDSFASLDDKSQRAVLDDIISSQLTDEQFHILTEYFKKYGK